MRDAARYEVTWSGPILAVRGAGFWNAELMTAYERDLRGKLAAAPRAGFGFLVSLSNSPAQDGKLVDRHTETTNWLANAGCKAVAIVQDSAILRLQLQRAAAGRIPLEAFETEAQARRLAHRTPLT